MPDLGPKSALGRLDEDDLTFLSRLSRKYAMRGGKLDKELAADLYQASLVYFLAKAADGWFDQPARLSEIQQRRNLLAIGLLDAVKGVWRDQKREVRSARDDAGEPKRETSDGVGLSAGQPVDVVQRLQEHQTADRLLSLSRRLNPARRLMVVGLHLPQRVLREDLVAAKGFKLGGARWVVRPVDEAWALVQDYRNRDEIALDEVLWKRVFAQIIRLEGELSLEATPEIDTAVNTFQVNHDRAVAQLAELARGEEPLA